MRIRGAASNQKQQAAQALSQIQQGQEGSGADLSLKQEFQAALEHIAGRGAGIAHQQDAQADSVFGALTDVAALEPSQNAELLRTIAPRENAPTTSEHHWERLERRREQLSGAANREGEQQPQKREQSEDQDSADSDKLTQQDIAAAAAPIDTQKAAVAASAQQAPKDSEKGAEEIVEDLEQQTLTYLADSPGNPSLNADSARQPATTKQTTASDAQTSDAVMPSESTEHPAFEALTAAQQSSKLGEGQLKTADFSPESAVSIEGVPSAQEDGNALLSAINTVLTQRLAASMASPLVAPKAEAGTIAINTERSAVNNIAASGRTEPSTQQNINLQGSTGFGVTKQNAAEREQAASRQPRIQPSKLLERVEQTLKEAAKSRDGKTISLRLDPPELGTLKVDISLREGGLHARIGAENSQVVNILRERAHELQGMLRKLGLDAERITVSIHTQGGGDFTQSESNPGNSNQQNSQQEPKFKQLDSGAPLAFDNAGVTSGSDYAGNGAGIEGWMA